VKRKGLIIATTALLVLLIPVIFRMHNVPLISNGEVVAMAKRSFAPHWSEGTVDVYVGKVKVFSLWADMFDFPLFIYPFADTQRFLCIYDDDTSVLVFVVNFGAADINTPNSSQWPTNDYVKTYVAKRATNVVMETKGFVRLPNYSELEEASSNLMSLTSGQFKTTSFPSDDFGVYRFYWTKEDLLSELATNRSSLWP